MHLLVQNHTPTRVILIDSIFKGIVLIVKISFVQAENTLTAPVHFAGSFWRVVETSGGEQHLNNWPTYNCAHKSYLQPITVHVPPLGIWNERQPAPTTKRKTAPVYGYATTYSPSLIHFALCVPLTTCSLRSVPYWAARCHVQPLSTTGMSFPAYHIEDNYSPSWWRGNSTAVCLPICGLFLVSEIIPMTLFFFQKGTKAWHWYCLKFSSKTLNTGKHSLWTEMPS